MGQPFSAVTRDKNHNTYSYQCLNKVGQIICPQQLVLHKTFLGKFTTIKFHMQ
jgi:hypothetical protein